MERAEYFHDLLLKEDEITSFLPKGNYYTAKIAAAGCRARQ